ncbi:MAG: N4-gp56 family major capsid protein [Clostridia bacterium]|nr:N4-gp56 family major capsid protein [Clostridia bacterium]
MREFLNSLQLFADAGSLVNGTANAVNAYTGESVPGTEGAMSSTMKTYYDTELLENAREKLVFSQLGKKQPLPANHGETVEWRKWNTFDKALTPLTEGVIPTGQKFGQSAINVTVQQYGDYAAITDRLDLHAVDDVILGATEEMGAAGGETADTLVRNELVTGTSVIYADTLDADGNCLSTPVGRYALRHDNNRLTPDMVNKAYTFLKKQKAPFFKGNKYAAVIHPSVAYDLRSSKDWIEAHKYSEATEIFTGEIGELHGVRFIESTEAPIITNLPLDSSNYSLEITAYTGLDTTASADAGVTTKYKATIDEMVDDPQNYVGREVYFYDEGTSAMTGVNRIVGATISDDGCFVWLENPQLGAVSGDYLYPGEGGDSEYSAKKPVAVYSTLFFGKDAFGVVEPEGMGMEMIIKDASEVGGPLNQFSTVGYKFENATKILDQNRMVRVESCSAYSLQDETN